jgi:IclR family mhp operon transcriptional activator
MASYEPVTALLRGLEVLRAVNRLPAASVKEIHRLTGLNQPGVVRMLETLIHAGFVTRDPEQAVYRPTGRTLELGAGYGLHREVGEAAGAVMTALRRQVGWPSDVAVFDGDAMVVAHTSRGEGRFLFERRQGYRAPILATSLGLSFLAFSDAAHRAQALALAARSPEPWNAAARQPDLAEALFAGIREAGFAVMDEAYAAREYGGLASSIGVPVLVGGQARAALNLMYLREAIDRDGAAARLLPVLRQAAAELGQIFAGLNPGIWPRPAAAA